MDIRVSVIVDNRSQHFSVEVSENEIRNFPPKRLALNKTFELLHDVGLHIRTITLIYEKIQEHVKEMNKCDEELEDEY